MNTQNTKMSAKAKEGLNKFKTEVASELGIDLKSDSLTAKDAGRVGGEMVRRLIEKSESNL